MKVSILILVVAYYATPASADESVPPKPAVPEVNGTNSSARSFNVDVHAKTEKGRKSVNINVSKKKTKAETKETEAENDVDTNYKTENSPEYEISPSEMKRYYFMRESVNWRTATRRCKENLMTLASFNEKTTQDVLLAVMKSRGVKGAFWTGDQRDGRFKCVFVTRWATFKVTAGNCGTKKFFICN